MICPICGEEVFPMETINTEVSDNFYYEYLEGRCLGCYKKWRWTEAFKFDHIQEVEEIEDYSSSIYTRRK